KGRTTGPPIVSSHAPSTGSPTARRRAGANTTRRTSRSGPSAPSISHRSERRLTRKSGLFDHPYADEARERAVHLCPQNQAAARELAGRSMVLLKNEGVLPLRKDVRSIAVLGPLADDRATPLGHWRGDGRVEDVVTLLAGIRANVADRNGPVRVD